MATIGKRRRAAPDPFLPFRLAENRRPTNDRRTNPAAVHLRGARARRAARRARSAVRTLHLMLTSLTRALPGGQRSERVSGKSVTAYVTNEGY